MSDESSKTDVLKVEEAAEEVGVHPETIRRYIRTGKLKAVRVGKRLIRIRREEWQAFLRNGESDE